MGHSDRYDDGLQARARGHERSARDLLPPRRSRTSATPPTSCTGVYEQTEGQDGYVSFELPPELAFDAHGLRRGGQALLRARSAATTSSSRCPGTAEGVEAFEELTAAGVSVNVTLLFDVQRYEEIAEAYVRGLERRAEAGEPIDRIASVASFFVSRVDGKVDAALDEHGGPAELKGKAAVANARIAYEEFRRIFSGDALGGAGGQGRQRPAAAVGVDVDEEPRLPGHALRRRADRPGHGQHDARRDDRRRARPRHAGAHGRQGRRRGAPRSSSRCARPASTSTTSCRRQLVDEGVEVVRRRRSTR